MANQLDEMNGPIMEQGHDVNVIAKQIPVTVGFGSKFFEIMLWVLGIDFEPNNCCRPIEKKSVKSQSTVI